VPFKRPAELARDETPGIDPLIHAIDTLPQKYDYTVLLQATSPLRTVADIDGCIEQCLARGSNACVSVTDPDKSPYWMYKITPEGNLSPLIKQEFVIRRQDLPPVFALNGAVYVAKTGWLKEKRGFISEETAAYLMPKERSLDIDTEYDFKICELYMGNFPV
jgi:N-acylneuraminate cytidylyltransferase